MDRPAAAEALTEMRRELRSGRLYGYTVSAPYPFVVGAAWLVGDLLFQFTEFGKAGGWAVVSAAASIICVGVAVRQSMRRTKTEASGKLDDWFWKGMALWVMLVAFTMATTTVFAPFSGKQIHSFTGLVSGMVYAVLGLVMGWRILATGAAVGALSLVGHVFIDEWYALYMGVVGGGGMMLAALWLRRV